MLSKSKIKACLAGEPTPIVPATFFALDAKFREKHEAEVSRMHEMYENDIVTSRLTLEKRAPDPELEPGEFTDDWGSLFCAAPDGVGAHPTRPIVNSIEQWEDYLANKIPLSPTLAWRKGMSPI